MEYIENVGNIIPIEIETEMKRSFIEYAMSVIVDRALPDVRDGMKPVHRRILYSMLDMGFTPDKAYRKCMATVGNVQGKYHPHGDAAIYDSLVRMGQDFSMRYPLVDGQGNFGSRDGDPPAAARYTEARLARISLELMGDIKKDTVDFRPNYDEHEMEPSVFPARFPNLLVNGTNGIAVGMASNIPTHNLGEVIDGIRMLLENPDCTTDELMTVIKGPDFPTGANILGKMGIREAYRTGHGKMIVRSECEIEQHANGKSSILVSELPYGVNKARLISRIAELVKDKSVEGISDIRDESDREHEVRINIELRRDANPQVVLNQLYKHTDLQVSFSANMLAIVPAEGGKLEPKVLNLKQLLEYYVDHQREVIRRRTQYELDKALARAHILEGYMLAVDNLDEVIRIIRSSKNVPEAKANLMERFGFSDVQAQHIVDMTLGRLTNLEVDAIRREYAELQETIARLRGILADMSKIEQIIMDELEVIRKKFGDPRRTKIVPYEGEIDIDDLINEEAVVVTMSNAGYVKRLPTDTYRAQRRGGKGIAGMSTKENDFVKDIMVCSSHDMLLFFTTRGRVFKLKAYQIPEGSRQAKGMAIVNLLQLEGGETVTAVLNLPEEFSDDMFLTLVTRKGVIKKTPMSEYSNIRKSGLLAIALREDDALVGVAVNGGECDIIITTKNGQCIRFDNSDVRPIGRVSQGVRGILLEEGDNVISMNVVTDDESKMLIVTEKGYGKRVPVSEYRVQTRGGKGVTTGDLRDKTGLLAGAVLVGEDDDVMLICDDGTIIRMPASDINVYKRAALGVSVMRVGDDTNIVGVARADKEPEEELPAEGEAPAAEEGEASQEAVTPEDETPLE